MIRTVALFLATIVASGTTAPQLPVMKAPTTNKVTTRKKTPQLPFEDARNMAVVILVGGLPAGSGVWLGNKGYVATCSHVIRDHTNDVSVALVEDPFFFENLAIGGNVMGIRAQVIDSNPDTDVAILKTPKPPQNTEVEQGVSILPPPRPTTPPKPRTPKGAQLRTELPELGETILLAGFPLEKNTLILQTGTATGVIVSPLSRPSAPPSTTMRLMLSLVSNPGNSGGPVFDANGKVIGLLEGNLQTPLRDKNSNRVLAPLAMLDPAGQPMMDANHQPQYELAPLMQNSGISLAVPSKFITELAKKNGISLD